MKGIMKHLTLVIASSVVSLALLGAGFFFLRPHLGARAHKPATPAAAEADHVMVELDEFTVNLADVDRARYMKVTLALEVTDSKTAEHIEKKLLPRVRDAIIMTLCKQYFRALNAEEGRESLKKQLATAVNDAVGEGHGKVADVLFVSLVMQ